MADDPASYRLPTTVLPRHYRLTLAPDLGAATFTGEVEIDVSVDAPVTSIVLNAAELAIASATLHPGDGGPGRTPSRSRSTSARSAPSSTSTAPSTSGRPRST